MCVIGLFVVNSWYVFYIYFVYVSKLWAANQGTKILRKNLKINLFHIDQIIAFFDIFLSSLFTLFSFFSYILLFLFFYYHLLLFLIIINYIIYSLNYFQFVGCASSGMLGMCCPTADGLMLACCDSQVGGEKRMQEEWKSLIYIDHAGTC